ncbi:MAG: hypothetical protein MJZ82_02440 [Paludibacteraceae bacterium]|nr:hypothetical protein [Paludibacteraceae bacterium]
MKKILCSLIVFAAAVVNVHAEAPVDVQMVDLGLSVNWASCNIGATAPEQPGSYYAWGETQEKAFYDWSSYQYGTDASQLTKYCNNPELGLDGFTDNLYTLLPEDDAATVNWGEDWRMPTLLEWTELMRCCTWTWTDNYNSTNVPGYIVSSPVNGNSIFLPTTGFIFQSKCDGLTTDGYYWASTLDDVSPSNAWLMEFFKEGSYCDYRRDNLYRSCGRPVRAVSVVKNVTAENGLDLQEIIDNAAAGSTIVLAEDYVLGGQTPDGVFINKALTLDLNGHTISGSKFVRCLFISLDNINDTIVIEDNSAAQTGGIVNGFSSFGGAIYIARGQMVFNSGKIGDSATDGFHWGGGGIYLDIDATLTMNGGRISGNYTDLAGGSGIAAIGHFTMNGGSIDSNISDGRGGAIRVEGGTTIHGGKIVNNTGLYGGGIFVCASTAFNLVTLDLFAAAGDSIVITGNTATGAEGGVTGNGNISLSGKIICRDNFCTNPEYKELKNFWTYDPVFIAGDLTGSSIFFGAANGDTDLPMCRVFAKYYADYHTADFTSIFTYEGPSTMKAVLNESGDIEIVSATALDTLSAEREVRKLMRDGQILIESNGRLFTLQGQLVE